METTQEDSPKGHHVAPPSPPQTLYKKDKSNPSDSDSSSSSSSSSSYTSQVNSQQRHSHHFKFGGGTQTIKNRFLAMSAPKSGASSPRLNRNFFKSSRSPEPGPFLKGSKTYSPSAGLFFESSSSDKDLSKHPSIAAPAHEAGLAEIDNDLLHLTVSLKKLDGKERARFLKGFQFERELTPEEETLLALLERSAINHGFDKLLSYLSGIPEEVLRRQVKLKAEAKSIGVSGGSFLQFVVFLQYCKKLSLHQDVSYDQINDILIAGNSTMLRVEDLFNGGVVEAKGGVRFNGIFGKQGNVKREKDLRDVDDLMPFLYILNHSIHKGNPLPAYFLMFGESPNPVTMKVNRPTVILEYNSGPWFNANIALARCEKFLDEAIGMSLDVTPLGIIVVDKNKKSHFIPVISAIYDLANMTLWRVERSDQHIFAQRMEVWLQTHLNALIYPSLPMFERKDIILKHIARLVAHSNHGSEHMQMRHTQSKKVGCVDGRQDNNKSEIGSLIGEKQLASLMADAKTNKISVVFHTGCGYLYTAITLHKLFKVLREGIHEDDTITLGRARLFINTLLNKPWVKRDRALFQEFVSHVDITKNASNDEECQAIHELLDNLVTDSQGTLRYATSHMSDRGVFEMCNGFPVMTAARHVEEAIAEHKLEISEKHKRHLIIEELTRLDRVAKTRFVEENRAMIAERRLSSILPSIEWMIEDLVSGRYFIIKDTPIKEQTPAEMLSLQRIDSKTHKTFQLQLC